MKKLMWKLFRKVIRDYLVDIAEGKRECSLEKFEKLLAAEEKLTEKIGEFHGIF